MNKFQFVDNIRFYSMLSIVTFHSCLIFLEFNKNDLIYSGITQTQLFFIMQFLRFGNVCFFMISGFLFGNKMSKSLDVQTDVKAYLTRRWAALKIPTLLFSLLIALLYLLIPIGKLLIRNEELSLVQLLISFVSTFFFGYTWFIYNLFIGFFLVVLAILYPKIKSFLFITTFITAIFWGINPYLKVINVTEHMFTFFGFSFYVLFGYYLGGNLSKFYVITDYINRNKLMYFSLLILLFVISYFESKYLYLYTNILPYYNLKLSSQIQSLIIFFGMCSFFTKPSYPSWADPKTETVGIYFMHSLVLSLVYYGSFIVLIFVFNIRGKEEINQQYLIPILVITSIFVYTFTVFLVKKIAKTKYSYLLGIS